MAAKEKRIFTLREAQALLPEVLRITARAVTRVEGLEDEFEALPHGDQRAALEAQAQEHLDAWAHEIEALGCEVKGLWLVDFDSGDGIYYCWQHPEERLGYFHDYDSGFAGRKPLGPMLVN